MIKKSSELRDLCASVVKTVSGDPRWPALKMSDGRTQYLDTATIDLKRGDRVQIGEDGVIRRG